MRSGIHPTIAGVLLADTIPTRSPPNLRGLLAQSVTLLNQVELRSVGWPVDGRHQATLETLETIADRMQSPAQHLERNLQPWSTYLILPLFPRRPIQPPTWLVSARTFIGPPSRSAWI